MRRTIVAGLIALAACSRGQWRRTIVAGLIALAACSRGQWREADATLSDAARAARAAGFQPMAGPHNTFGTFTAAGSASWRVHLEAHQPYFVAAACTSGCDTLDFIIAEPHGAAVGSDTTAGPTPRLLLTAPEEGDYVVTFRWGACTSAERCRWVAQVYAKSETR